MIRHVVPVVLCSPSDLMWGFIHLQTRKMDPYSHYEVGRSVNLVLHSVYCMYPLRGAKCRDVDVTPVRMKCFQRRLKLSHLVVRSGGRNIQIISLNESSKTAL